MNINSDLGTPQPLYFYHNTTEFVTIEDGTSQIQLDAKQQIDLYCTDGFRSPFTKQTNMLTATCVSGKQFIISNKTVNLMNAACNSKIDHTTRLSNRNCVVGKTVEIGYNVNGEFLNTFFPFSFSFS